MTSIVHRQVLNTMVVVEGALVPEIYMLGFRMGVVNRGARGTVNVGGVNAIELSQWILVLANGNRRFENTGSGRRPRVRWLDMAR